MPHAIAADFFDELVGHDRSRRDFGHIDFLARVCIAMLQQQPLVPFFRTSFDVHERPLAEHFFSVELERELA